MRFADIATATTVIFVLCLSNSPSGAAVHSSAAGKGCNVLGDTVIKDGELYYSDSRSGPYKRQSDDVLKTPGEMVHFIYVAGPIGTPKPGAVVIRHSKKLDPALGHDNYAKTVYLRRSPGISDMRIALSSFRRYHENGAGSRALARHFHFKYRSGGRGNARTDDTPLKLNSAQLQATEQPSETAITKRLLIPFSQNPLATCIGFNLAVGNAEHTDVAIERIDAYDIEHLPEQYPQARNILSVRIEAGSDDADESEANNSEPDPQ